MYFYAMNTRLALICFVFLSFLRTHAQSCDTNNIKNIISQSEKEMQVDMEQAYRSAYRAYSLSKKCPNTNCFYKSTIALAKVYGRLNQPDSVIILLTPIFDQLPIDVNKYYSARIKRNLSLAYAAKLKLQPALKFLLASLKDYEDLKDSLSISNMLSNLGDLYRQLKNFKQADICLRKAEVIASKLKNDKLTGNVYNTIGILYAENRFLDSAEKFFLRSIAFREKINDPELVWNYNNLGGLYLMQKKPKPAIVYFAKALEGFEKTENYDGQTSVAKNLGQLYMETGDYKKALEFFSYSRKLYSKTNNLDNLENLYNDLSNYYDKINDLKTAFAYSDSLIVLKDSLYGLHLDESMAEMQTKYETEKKDLEIANNKTEIKLKDEESKQKTTIIFSIIGFAILLSISAFLFYRKKKIEQQAIVDSEIAIQKELRVKSVIEAEEKERRRIAQDLHDGVGQILSAAKLNLSGLESQINLEDQKQKDSFKNAMDLIDDSVKEVRAVSHNMMPNTLIKLGLASAIKEFITKLGNVPNLKIDLEIVGLDKRIDENVETVLYRVIQEIVANIIKHAKASEISLQMIKHERELSIIVEDNGVGFDTSKINIFEGIGLKNIISRIEFINGTVHFDSTINHGTTVVIEVKA